MSKFFMTCAAAVALAALPGCYKSPYMDYSKANLVDAYGVVTQDGKPLPQATVVFEAPDKQYSYAKTDDQGRYQLQFDSVKAGVTPGQKTVRITTAGGGLGEEAESVNEEAPAVAPAELVPVRYNKQSELSVNVTPEQTEYNFELKSN